MKYLPILQELFESNTFVFMIIGIVIAAIAGMWWKNQKKDIIAVITSVVIYGFCELVSNVHTNFMLELTLLFIGTAAVGCCIGFIIHFLIGVLKASIM